MSALVLHAMFALGGGLGAVMRHWLNRRVVHRFPLSTLIVNALGSLVLGAGLAALGTDGGVGEELPRRLVFGFCGGFTTFSSFAVRSIELHGEHAFLHTVANVAINLATCLVAFWLGGVLLGG